MAMDGIVYMGQTSTSSSSNVMSGLDYEGGDVHKHGCLDALAMTLSLRWSSQESCNERISLLFFASRRCTEQEFQHADNSYSWVLVP